MRAIRGRKKDRNQAKYFLSHGDTVIMGTSSPRTLTKVLDDDYYTKDEVDGIVEELQDYATDNDLADIFTE